MALILFGSYMVRYPLGGNLSWPFQWIYGFRQLGHDVYLVEASSGWDCFDPQMRTMGDDARTGLRIVNDLFARHGIEDRIIFRDRDGAYPGVTETRARELFRAADLFIDLGTHGAWRDLAQLARRRVLVDGEPGYNQMRIAREQAEGIQQPVYDAYYTHGYCVPDRHPGIPDCGVQWRIAVNPVAVGLYPFSEPPAGGAFTTVMNWQAHKPTEYEGKTYGQKDMEFPKFARLPCRVRAPMEVAVAGKNVPRRQLEACGWRIRHAHEVTATFDSYGGYIRGSLGEFSVAKNIFVATRCGWFSDRSACYLASGRPVVLQDTGFSEHLPCGEGLFAVRDEDQAAAAIDAILSAPGRHARRAREIAEAHLGADVLLPRFLLDNGL